jgi:hypothetical protein
MEWRLIQEWRYRNRGSQLYFDEVPPDNSNS